MNRSTGRKTRSPGALSLPYTLAMYLPRGWMHTSRATIRTPNDKNAAADIRTSPGTRAPGPAAPARRPRLRARCSCQSLDRRGRTSPDPFLSHEVALRVRGVVDTAVIGKARIGAADPVAHVDV